MPKTTLNLKATKHDGNLISKIIQRAIVEKLIEAGEESLDLSMDLTAVHLNGTPMHLYRLLTASRFDLAHDLGGIRRHIDRTTGQLGGCFGPRHALNERERAQAGV